MQTSPCSCMLVGECGRARYPLSGYCQWRSASSRRRRSAAPRSPRACTSTRARRPASSIRFRSRRFDKRHRVAAVRARTATRHCSAWESSHPRPVPAARVPHRQSMPLTAAHPHGPECAALPTKPRELVFPPSCRGRALRAAHRPPPPTRQATSGVTAGSRWWRAAAWFSSSAEAAGCGCGAATSGPSGAPAVCIGVDQWQPAT
jgi:hypothetical protein